MKEYRLKINGEIDFVIISLQVLSSLIAQIRNSPKRKAAANIEDIMPPGFTEYLLRVINGNRFFPSAAVIFNCLQFVSSSFVPLLVFQPLDCAIVLQLTLLFF